jgi:hypothetical protein
LVSRPAHTQAGQKLLRIVKRFRQNFLIFVTNCAIPDTNNGSEQALRSNGEIREVGRATSAEMGTKKPLTMREIQTVVAS